MRNIKKTFIPVIAIGAVIMAGLLCTSCHNNNPPGGKGSDTVYIPNPKDTSALGKIDHSIPRSEIKQFRRAFNAERDSLARINPGLFITESEGFNKTQLLDLLKDPKCVGLRIYYGVTKGDKGKELRMIIVGTDSQGKDLYITRSSGSAANRLTQDEVGLEYGQCCHGLDVEQ